MKNMIKRGFQGRSYNRKLPEGNNGLGLMLLGLTGDQVLEPEVYKTLKAKALSSVQRNRSGRYSERRSGAKHLYFFY